MLSGVLSSSSQVTCIATSSLTDAQWLTEHHSSVLTPVSLLGLLIGWLSPQPGCDWSSLLSPQAGGGQDCLINVPHCSPLTAGQPESTIILCLPSLPPSLPGQHSVAPPLCSMIIIFRSNNTNTKYTYLKALVPYGLFKHSKL